MNMLPREIHDPEVLKLILKECDFMTSHCADHSTSMAYRQMSIAARVLRDRILGRHHRYKCVGCGREIALCQDGTFRFHYSHDGVRQNCRMSGKFYEANEPK